MKPPRPVNEPEPVETDERFPTGPWTGFYLEESIPPGRHWMELQLTFRNGLIRGEGRDRVGEFLIVGRYEVDDGKCWWSKRYIGKHDVAYKGFNEGKGIWGTWEIPRECTGGFHIWPVGMPDPTLKTKAVEAEVPTDPLDVPTEVEPVAAGAGEPAFDPML